MLAVPKRIFALDISDQTTLSFGWANFDGSQTIYITDSPTLNQITITMTNNTKLTATFPAGEPYSMESSGSAGVLYIQFMGQYIPADDVSVMSLTATSGETPWSFAVFSDSEDGTYLALAPQSEVAMGIGDSITFLLTNVMTPDVTATNQGGTVVFTYNKIKGLGNLISVPVPVPLLNAPDTTLPNLAPVVGFAITDMVFIGPEGNSLTLYITNSQTTAITLSDTPTAPVFSVNFIFGQGTGALTTVNLSDFSVNMTGGNVNDWNVIPNNLGGSPYWQFQPQTATVLGLELASTAEITFSNIITELPPGVTTAVVAWTGIPGYNDGEVSIDIVKVSPVVIKSFTPSPPSFAFPTGPQSVALSFNVQNATYITVTNTLYAQQTNNPDFSGQASADITSSTTFTLIASNVFTGQQVSQSTTVTVTPDLYSLLPMGTVVMWAGDIGNIPTGWALCDGTTVNNLNTNESYTTPNLTDQFVIGAGGTIAPQTMQQGGPDQHTHNITIDNQTFQTSTDGTHTHSMSFLQTTCMSSGDTSHFTLYYGVCNNKSTGGHDSTTSQDTSSDGSHNHNVSVGFSNVVSATQTGGINPPWFSLAYIVKIF